VLIEEMWPSNGLVVPFGKISPLLAYSAGALSFILLFVSSLISVRLMMVFTETLSLIAWRLGSLREDMVVLELLSWMSSTRRRPARALRE